MSFRWNPPQHSAALQQLNAALRAGADDARRGAVVVGPDGAGKSTLARLAAEHAAGDGSAQLTRWVAGTPSEARVPFGALSHLVEIAELGKPAALLRAARESLLRDAAADDLLFVVDDAQFLDVLSATLVYQLALTGAARMIVTAGPDAAPGAITALWSDGLLDRIDIDASAAGDSGGDVDAFLAELPEPARSALNHLAVQAPLAHADLSQLTGGDAVACAEELGAVETRTRGGRGADPVVYTAHPAFAIRALAALDADEARRLRTDVVGQLSQHHPEHVSDRLRLASLAVDSDAPQDVGEVTDAARQALRLGDVALAERLARSALQRADGADGMAARLVLAYALTYQGRGRDADAVLSAVDPAELTERELMAWALPRAANQFWMLSEPAQATAFLQTARERVTGPGPRATLDALLATFAVNAGTPLRALPIAEEVLACPDADATAVGWAASAAALASSRVGRFGDVEALADRALTAEHPGLLRFTSGFGQISMLMFTGRLDEARSLAQRHTDFAELQQPGRAIGEVLVAYVATAQGDLDTAATLLRRAAEALSPTGYSWGPLALMLLASVLGQQGDLVASAKVLSAAEARHGMKSALFTPELGLARAWSKAARGDKTGAIEAARGAVHAAERSGQSAIALRALHDAARLGDTLAAARAERLLDEVDYPLGQLTATYARALAADDATALTAVAADLTAAGLHPAAADAAAAAQRCAQPPG